MEEKIKLLLKRQLEKLDEDGFDLEAWKSSTIAMLDRVFGNGNPKSRQISKITMDFGSWSLRDTSASRDPLGSCKKQGREILDIALAELEMFGIPDTREELVSELLQNEFTLADIRKILETLESEESEINRKHEITKILKKTGKDQLVGVITEYMMKL